jgi:membrane protein DedA with SNARE-associated domain/rhodanese-related sulfurtransferase
MNELLALIAHHGYAILFLIVLAEALGLPVPAALALITGGAAVASGALYGPTAVVVAVAGMLLGDVLLYFLGSRMGWRLLGILCRVSADPETCILRSAESFYKRGRATLLVAKFIPGVNSMAPPLAGSMKMPLLQFLGLDFVGAMNYALIYGAVGFIFRDFLATIVRGFQTVGHVLEIVVILAVIGFTAYRLSRYWRHRGDRIVPRVHVTELAAKLQTQYAENILLADVRSHGYYDPGAARIRGSIRLEPSNLSEEAKMLPREKEIYLYCSCPHEATSAHVGYLLRERGFNAFVIIGGLAAWRKAGNPVEAVPPTDLIHLPTFSRRSGERSESQRL